MLALCLMLSGTYYAKIMQPGPNYNVTHTHLINILLGASYLIYREYKRRQDMWYENFHNTHHCNIPSKVLV